MTHVGVSEETALLTAFFISRNRWRRTFELLLFGVMLTGCSSAIVAPHKSLSEHEAAETNDSNDDSAEARPTPLERMINRPGISFRLIPAGGFLMGTDDVSPFGDFAACEQPQHFVRLTRSFWMSECEVTVGQFRRFVAETGYRTEAEQSGQGVVSLDLLTGEVAQRSERIWSSPGFAQTDAHPVVGVSRLDALKFCAWLSQSDGETYRLPTEAEWEYACRAGTKTAFASGDTFSPHLGNVGDMALRKVFSAATDTEHWSDQFPFTAPVGSFQPNRFGLFDMHGNVGEWCDDWFDAKYYAYAPEVNPRGPPSATQWRVVRGGSWYNTSSHCRSAGRHDGLLTAPSTTNGFRVVMEAILSSESAVAN